MSKSIFDPILNSIQFMLLFSNFVLCFFHPIDRFVFKNNGVLFENDLLQIGVKSEFRQNLGRLALFYGNKTQVALEVSKITIVAHLICISHFVFFFITINKCSNFVPIFFPFQIFRFCVSKYFAYLEFPTDFVVVSREFAQVKCSDQTR